MRCLTRCLLLLSLFVTQPMLPTWAAPRAQTTDPLRLCRQGIDLYEQGNMTAAFPLLESAFQRRDEIPSPAPTALDTLAHCAALLGELYEFKGELDLAATAYQAALETAQANANFADAATALLGLGNVSYKQGDLPNALDVSQQALVAARKTTPANEAKALLQLGVLYSATGDLIAALKSVELALSLYQQQADRVGEGTAQLFQGEMNLALGRLTHAFAAYSDALLTLSDAEDPVGSVRALLAMAGFLIDVGEYAAAQSYLDRAQRLIDLLVDIAQSYPGNQAAMLTVKGQHLLLQGKLYSYTAGFKEAVSTIQEAYEVFQDAHDLQGQANTLSNWGMAEKNLGQFEQARQHLAQAQKLYAQLSDFAGEVNTINHLGGLHRLLGEYDKAEDYYNQALTRARQVGSRLREGAVWNNLGLLYQGQGRLAAALAAYQQALALTKPGGNPESESATLLNLATLYQSQGRLDLALDTLEQAKTIADDAAIVGTSAIIGNSLGLIHLGRQQYTEALAVFESAAEIAEEIGDRELLATVLNNTGRLYFEQENYDLARSEFDQALATAQQTTLPVLQAAILRNLALTSTKTATEPEHYAKAMALIDQSLALAPALTNPIERSLTLAAQGDAYRIQEEVTAALTSYTAAMDLLENVRLQAGSETGRAEFIAQYQDLYNRVVELYVQQGQPAQAFAVSERARARAFLDSLATDYIELSDQAAAAVLQAEHEAYARLQASREAFAFIQARTSDAAQMGEQEAQLAAAEQDYQTALANLARRDTTVAALAPGRSAVLTLAQVQALLDAQTTLLSYWLLENRALAFIVTAHQVEVVELPAVTPDALLKLTDSLYKWLNTDNAHPRSLQQLYDWLIAPLTSHLHTSHVVVIPHQQLHYVPFAGLTDGVTYFGEQFTLSVLPSATALQYLQKNAQAAQRNHSSAAVIFGDPASNEPGLPRLSYAQAEANAVAAILQTNALTDTAASEATLHEMVSGARVVHLAAHGSFSQTNALASAIYLAPSSLTSTEGVPPVNTARDGRLETREIFGLPLAGNDLVVLSACQTNLGNLSHGDELVGLTRAFFFAKSPTVISSLWNVDDAATEALMVSFYRHWLQDGMSKAEALQAAQTDVRTDPRWVSPFYWVGFVLNGHPGENLAQ